MKTLVALLVVGVSCAVFWVVFPTEISVTSQTYYRVPEERFAEAEDKLSAFARTFSASGIEIIGGDERSGSIAIKCRSLPIVTLLRHEDVAIVQVFNRHLRRVPDAGQVLSAIEVLGGPLNIQVDSEGMSEPPKATRFVLKYRDGVDLDDTCLQ